MMTPSRLLPALLLLAVALAGCLGSSPSPAPASEDDEPGVVEDPTNYTYVDNASFETGGHVHDYWDGRDKLTVIARSQGVGTLTVARDEDRERLAVFRPPSGNTIPQGTAEVRVNVAFSENNPSFYQDPQLWIRTAADDTFHHLADLESNETTITIESTNAENDLPHRLLSGWAFAFYADHAAVGTMLVQFNVTLQVEAIRGLELPVFPAHPDHWGDRSEISLLDETRETFVWNQGGTCANCEQQLWHRPDDGTIVPFDAAMVRVHLEPQTDSPTRVGLEYHGADTWNHTRLTPDETDDRTRIYEIPLGREMADGPYNEQSLWRFRPYVSDPVVNGTYAGSYRITATAIRDAADDPGSGST